MNDTIALLSTGVGGTILGVLLLVYKTINHKRLRCGCCGKTAEVSFDVGNITPTLVVPEKKDEEKINENV